MSKTRRGDGVEAPIPAPRARIRTPRGPVPPPGGDEGLIPCAKRVNREIFFLRQLIRRERKGQARLGLPLRRRMTAWRHGFIGSSAAMYDLQPTNRHLYLPSASRLTTPFINGIYNPILNDKLVFFYTMAGLSAPIPKVYGLVTRDRVAWIDPPSEASTRAGVMSLLDAVGDVILKPMDGGLGESISLVSLRHSRLVVNGVELDNSELEALLRPGTLIQERVHQGLYAEAIYPHSTNTVRVLTMWDYARDEPFVASAVHRFGTDASSPVDNWSQGGLSAAIDLRSGTLGPAARFTDRLEWHETHPDSHAAIAGVTIRNWDAVLREVLRVSSRLGGVVYIGWDVIVRDDDFVLLEGNSYTDENLLQVHKPLLADPRVRAFYEHHGVIPHH